MKKVWTLHLGAFLGGVIATAGACSSDRGGFDRGLDGEFQTTADAGVESSACVESALRCSRDLRAVVDACDESRIVTECPPDQGCADSKCVPACDIAVSRSASAGCEFIAVRPSYYHESGGSCFAAFVANTWGTPVRVEAEFGGGSLDLTRSARIVRTSGTDVTYEPFSGELQPDEIAILFLEHAEVSEGVLGVRCPDGIQPALLEHTSIATTGRGSSYRIKTSAPVSAYSIYPFGGAVSRVASASLLLPVAALKNEYVVTNAWEKSVDIATAPTTQIIAAEDETDVTIVGSVAIQPGVGVEGAEMGVPKTYRLNRGEMIQFVQNKDLTGTLVSATKSVAVWGGHECLRIPQDQAACDQSTRQLFPLQSWGNEYAAVPHLTRRKDKAPERYFYRITAAVDDTTLTYEPKIPDGAPTSLAKGATTIFTAFEPFVVKSQDKDHPIALFEYMSGQAFAPAEFSDGDPEFSGVVPPDQYLDSYVFYVDTTYRNSQLVVIRSRTPGKEFDPVVLDCSGPLEGWTPLGTEGKYEYTRFYVTRSAQPQKVGSGICGAGRHKIESEGAFGVTVWGTDYRASYAYPGGAAIRALNAIKLPGVN